MGLFRRSPDPLEAEIRRLQQESRRLTRQQKVLRDELENPDPSNHRERPVPIVIETTPAPRQERRESHRLRAQGRRARNRFLLVCAVLLVLLLLLYRAVT
jgi:hypothetical protein